MKYILLSIILFSSATYATDWVEKIQTIQSPLRDQVAYMNPPLPLTKYADIPIGDGSLSVDITFFLRKEIYSFSLYSGIRSYLFEMQEGARQSLRLRMTDDCGCSGGLSHNLLETSMYFFPRLNLPAVNAESGVFHVTLPTGEIFEIDTQSGSLARGALQELGPVDRNPDRHQRNFARVRYNGKGLTMRLDRRAGYPELIYSQSYNVNEDIKNALVEFDGKTCKIGKEHLFSQVEDENLQFLFPTDEPLFAFIESKCKWPGFADTIKQRFP